MNTNKNNMNKELVCRGGYTKLPATVKNKAKSGKAPLSVKTKLIYVFILYCKRHKNKKKFNPTYAFMKKAFGITSATYKKALDELASANMLYVEYVQRGLTGALKITLNDEIAESGKYTQVPNVLLRTSMLTNSHKMFMAFLWSSFVKKKTTDDYYMTMSESKVCEVMSKIGFSKATVYKMLKEMSDPTIGYINILTKDEYGYRINHHIIEAMYAYLCDQLEEYSNGMRGTIEYVSPIPFEYYYDNNTGEIFRKDGFNYGKRNILTKIASNEPTREELELQKQQDIERYGDED